MDGVLIDARDWHYEALNKALLLFGYEINRYEHLTTFDGLPTIKKLEMLSIEKNLPRPLHKFINEMKQIYTTEQIFLNCKPKFQHQFALSKLRSMNYQLALCSNSIRNTIQLMLEKSALTDYLDFYLSNQDVENPKPAPDIYLKAIKKLNLTPNECLIYEDNQNGLKAAYESGAHVMKVESPEDIFLERIVADISAIEEL